MILRDGLYRMAEKQEDVYFYLTLMNENYAHPGLNKGDEEGILRGMYKFKSVDGEHRVQLKDWGIGSDVWSATSFTELRREGLDCERYALLNPKDANAPKPYVTTQLEQTTGPIIASTDYVKAFADQIRAFIPENRTYRVLGKVWH